MPPKRKATAGDGESKGPMLKLTVEKGPLAGQSNVYGPRVRIQIGRVVRGNKLCIKDPGISSKHLAIEVDSGSDKWRVTDLGSSNGTFLNDRLLDSDESAVISEGDIIRIGETTSIKVSYDVGEVASESGGGQARRNPRRGARNQVAELDVIDEGSELGLGEKLVTAGDEIVKGKRIGGSEGVDDEEKSVNGDGGVKGKGRGKSRSSKKAECLVDSSVDEEKVSVIRPSSEVAEVELVVDDREKVEDEDVSKGKGRRNTRGSKKDLGVGALVGGPRVSTRATRSSRKEEVLVDLSVIEGKGKKRGGRGKTNTASEKTVEDDSKGELVLEQEVHDGKALPVAVDDSFVVEGAETVAEGVAGMAETCGIQEAAAGEAGTSGVKEDVPEVAGISKEGAAGYVEGKSMKDLDTMTMGEWLKFLQVFLPQHIIIETEKCITEMEDKARRLHDFRLQHMRAKAKAGEGTN